MVELMATRWQVLLIMSLWGLFIGFGGLLYFYHGSGSIDSDVYFRAAADLRAGNLIYEDNTQGLFYLYPPLLSQLLAPITAAPNFTLVRVTWFIMNVALLIVSTWLIADVVSTKRRWLVWVSSAFFLPYLLTLWFGQVTLILLILFVGAWRLLRARRSFGVGVLLAIAAWIKVYPAIILMFYLWKRDRGVIFGGAIAGIILLGLQLIGAGIDNMVYYFTVVLPNLALNSQMELAIDNQSITGFASHLFVNSPQIIPIIESNLLFTITRWGLILALLGSLFWISRPSQENTPLFQRELEYCLALMFSLLFASTLWLSGLTPLLMIFVVLVMRTSIRQRRYLYYVFVFIGGGLIFHELLVMGRLQPPSDATLLGLYLSIPFFGLMLLWGLLLWRHQQDWEMTSISN
jgi:hypothetical protein